MDAIQVFRGVLAAAMATGLAASLSGCSPATEGKTGVTVDQAGRPVAVLYWCKGEPPEGISFYPKSTNTPPPHKAPSWRFDLRADEEPSGRYAEVPLYAPPENWSTSDAPLGELAPGRVYILEGDYEDVNKMFSEVELTTASLARIKPGIVMTQGYDTKAKKPGNVYQTRVEFERDGVSPACR